jgi:hypothetical protein
MYLWRHEGTTLYQFSVYIEIEYGACGALRMMTIFDLVNLVFADIGELAKSPFLAHAVLVVWFRNT